MPPLKGVDRRKSRPDIKAVVNPIEAIRKMLKGEPISDLVKPVPPTRRNSNPTGRRQEVDTDGTPGRRRTRPPI